MIFSTLIRAEASLECSSKDAISRRCATETAVSFFCAMRRRGIKRRRVDFSLSCEGVEIRRGPVGKGGERRTVWADEEGMVGLRRLMRVDEGVGVIQKTPGTWRGDTMRFDLSPR